MSNDEHTEFRIRRAEEHDLEDIATFLKRVFERPGWPALENSESAVDYLRWKIWDKSVSRSQQLIAEANSRIVATFLTVIREFSVRGQTMRARERVDAAVDPAYRGRGLMRDLQTYSNEHLDTGIDLVISFTLAPQMARIRVGLTQPLGNDIRAWVRPLSLRGLLEAAHQAPRFSHTMRLLRSFLSRRSVSNVRTLRQPAWVIRTTEDFDERIDSLFSAASRAFDFIELRDQQALNWRYRDPRAGQYKIRIAEQNDRVGAYCVTRRSQRKGYIIDMLALPSNAALARLMIEDAVQRLTAQAVDVIECWLPERHPYVESLRQLCFTCAYSPGFEYRSIPGDREELRFLKDPQARIHMTRGDSDIG